MTRWLQMAMQVQHPVTEPTKPTEPRAPARDTTVLSVKSVLSGGCPLDSDGGEKHSNNDPALLAAALRRVGPMSYGAAATALGWGATRAWQAEAKLRGSGLVHLDALGRATLSSGKTEADAEGDARRERPEGEA